MDWRPSHKQVGFVPEETIMLYRPPSTDEQPAVDLARWQVFKVDDGEMHFVGHIVGGQGRVSSPIKAFDLDSMAGVTRSGRRYRLVGEPGQDSDGLYVWAHWCAFNRIERSEEVSLGDLSAAFADVPVGQAKMQ